MSEPAAAEDLASYLRGLKNKTGRSYDTLAKRLGISKSTLHRYCSGESVPPRFTLLEQFAKECKANRHELTELHRRWLSAQTAQTSAAEPGTARQAQPGNHDSSHPQLSGVVETPPVTGGLHGRLVVLRESRKRWTLGILSVLSVAGLLIWRPHHDPQAAAETTAQKSAGDVRSCTTRRGVKHADARQNGHVWTTDFVCANRPETSLYLTVGTTEKIAVLDTPKSWFVCWSLGRVQSDGGTIWYYTRGDRSEPGKEAWAGWGFAAAEYVEAVSHPLPDMPECRFAEPVSSSGGPPAGHSMTARPRSP
ncbi:helix-turn-helix domain-containing protein [Streptosporangium minutum]|uniref:HTH cro/C1-type domain-containing protein n=1 Tax=Streptosporangium minutum TaxID=569862 RepID=A0A243RCL1_9ACTN|nr:helix-turn-helix transcriptional regulator [Streptosporangium minutum]OUC91708.1 hypothetical protein CA984_32720 [Streptosporangium minutum]